MTTSTGPGQEPERVTCANPDHDRTVTAVARLFWPGGHHDPTTACATDLAALLHDSLEDRYPVEVWPATTGPANPLRFGGWRQAPDCGRCEDRGRFREENSLGGVTEAHCTCKRGRRMSELWLAAKEGYAHPDEPEPEPDYDPEGPPF
jgi:hypothetical protein